MHLLVLFILFSFSSFSQVHDSKPIQSPSPPAMEEPKAPIIYEVSWDCACGGGYSFPNGHEGLTEHFQEYVGYYTCVASDVFEVSLFVLFTVSKDGRVSDVVVEDGVCHEIDSDMLKAVRRMPMWINEDKHPSTESSRMRLPIKILFAS